MKTRTLKQLLLYKYRYIFGYGLVVGLVLYFLAWQLGSIGPGLTQLEIVTSARHTNLTSIANLPIYPLHSALQWLTTAIAGVSVITIRIPSVIISILVGITLYHLLKKWFGKPTALLSTLVLLTADWFLFIARLGSGEIEFSFWLVLMLLALTKLIEKKDKWFIVLAASTVALLFVPFGIYALIPLYSGLVFTKMFRERFTLSPRSLKISSLTIVSVGILLALYASLHNHDFAKQIVGINALPGFTEYFKNVFLNVSSVVAVFPRSDPMLSPYGIFFIRFFELIFIIFGVIMLWKTRVNRLNLTVLTLTVVLALASGLSSAPIARSLFIIPTGIFMTAGIRHLVHRWQRTFPKNPYARIAAFVPLGILFITVMSLHYVSYFELWPNQAETHSVFTKDFTLIQKELANIKYKAKLCYVDTNQESLQTLIAASNSICKPIFTKAGTDGTTASVIIVRPDVATTTYAQSTSKKFLVSEEDENSARWVVVTE